MSALFVRLDVNWIDHPKLLRAGVDGAGLHAIALCMAKRDEADGWIDRLLLIRYGATDELIERLVELRLFELEGELVRPWGWHSRNPSQGAIDARRASKSASGRLGNHRRYGHPGDLADCRICAPKPQVTRSSDRTSSQGLALASPETETETDIKPPKSLVYSQPEVAKSAPAAVDHKTVLAKIVGRVTRAEAANDPTVASVEAVLPSRRKALMAERGAEALERLRAGDDPGEVERWLADPLGGVLAPTRRPTIDPTTRPALRPAAEAWADDLPAAGDPSSLLAAARSSLRPVR